MLPSEHNSHMMIQSLIWGAITEERISPADTMYASTGRRLYVIGDIDGRFRPRSNAYDLHAFGSPRPDDPLAGKLQGVWAQPVKGFDSYAFALVSGDARWELYEPVRFTQTYAGVEFEYENSMAALLVQVTRRDIAALDLPVLFSTLDVSNLGTQPLVLQVCFTAHFDLQDAWFTSLAGWRNKGQTASVEEECLAARSEVLPDRWAAAAGSFDRPEYARILDDGSGEIVCNLVVAPGECETAVFMMAVETDGGVPAALEAIKKARANYSKLLDEKQTLYEQTYKQGPRLVSPDPALNRAFDAARANLQMLEAEQPSLGRYFYAGLDMFPFWFSNDGAYSLPGLMVSRLDDSCLNHIRIGLDYLDQGRVPHQISPSGKMAFAGNAEETPLWVMSIWDAFRWSGDRAFLSALYPHAWNAMFNYVLGTIDPDGDGYPSGHGMVEVEGMGAEKLDSAVYTWAALNALAKMSETLGKTIETQEAARRADEIAARFEADWWDEPSGTYAMSLEDPGNARSPLPHWAVIVPLEVGLAAKDHAARSIATIRRDYLNRWGLKHTVGSDERVWTLPTATLSRAAYRYQEPDLGFEMLRRIADTLGHGSIGLFHELIPEGACIVQLWSGAVFLRGIVEDLLGIEVRADLHRLRLCPRLPADWDEVRLENLVFSGHCASLHFTRHAVRVDHHAGPADLLVEGKDTAQRAEVGGSVTVTV